jgi:hypothetical protein
MGKVIVSFVPLISKWGVGILILAVGWLFSVLMA